MYNVCHLSTDNYSNKRQCCKEASPNIWGNRSRTWGGEL